MPGKDKKKRPSLLDDFVIIDRLEPIGEADKRSVKSMPALRRSGSNEANQQLQKPGDLQSNEAMREEEQHKHEEQEKRSSVIDQNGPAPQDKEPEEQEVSLEEIENVSFDSRRGDMDSIISNEIPQDIQPNDGLNRANAFVPQQTNRSKWSKTARLNHYFWRGVGNTIGKASVLPASAVGLMVTIPLKSTSQQIVRRGQPNRDHRYIPGRNNMIYNDRENSGADILNDFRRVPTVWSYLTAARATENDGRDVEPKVTAYVEQPKRGSSRSMHYLEMGHAMIGIEYTRPSKITGRKERYNIKYGFYPAVGGFNAAAAEMMLKGAVVPGRLIDDAGHKYDISKTYTVTRRQVENIAKASESYTEQGGYGYYTRNCTTFVRDMFRAGNLPENAIDSIFTEEVVRFNSLANGAFVFANAWNGFWDTSWQSQMAELAKEDDRSYQGWGNKRVTKADMDRYLATKNSAGLGVTSLSPASAGENMRRMTDAEGQIGSYMDTSDSLEISSISSKNLSRLAGALEAEGDRLYEKIRTIMTYEQFDTAGQEFRNLIGALPDFRFPIDRLRNKVNNQEGGAKPEDVKATYAEISDGMAKISKMYQKFLGSDSRINKDVMHLLSSLQYTLETLDDLYRKQTKASDTGEIGTRREEMLLYTKKIKVGDIEVEMTPSHYESYLYIYNTPLAAVNAYKRYKELTAIRNGNDKNLKSIFSNKKLAEWKQLAQNEKLANQMDQSHRHMLNKNSFSQQDIDYVFNLRKKEMARIPKRAARGNEMYASHSTASETYMSLFFDMIFRGIQSEAQKNVGEGGCPTDAGTMGAALWMDRYLAEKTRSEMTGMASIIRGIMRAYNDKTDPQNVKEILHYFIQNAYLQKAFPSNNAKGPTVCFIGTNLKDIYSKISTDPQMSFSKIIDSLIRIVMMENAQVTVLSAARK